MEDDMRTGLSLSLAAGAVALALLAPVKGADAASLPGASQLPAAAQDIGSVEQARNVCRRYFDGYRWRQRCWWAPGPRYDHWGSRRWRYRHHRW
jgi:predicted secreted protein